MWSSLYYYFSVMLVTKENYKTLFQGSIPSEQQKVRTWESPDLYFISINTRY